jgi:hypothetical protein
MSAATDRRINAFTNRTADGGLVASVSASSRARASAFPAPTTSLMRPTSRA